MSRSLHRSSTRAALLAAAALAFAAPAARAQGGMIDLLTPPPPVSVLLDSAALVQDVARLALQPPPSGIPPVFSLDFDSTGAPQPVKAMHERMPAAYGDPVIAAITARLRPQPPSRRGIHTYVRVIAGPHAVVDRPKMLVSQPELVNRNQVSRLLGRAADRHAAGLRLFPRGTYFTMVHFPVRTDGTPVVEEATLMQPSGNPGLDQEALDVVGEMRFRPATVGGIPVRVWVTVPVTFQVPTPPRADELGAPAQP